MSSKYRMMILTVDRTTPTKLWPKHINYKQQKNYIHSTARSLINNGGFSTIKDDIFLYDSGSDNLDYLNPVIKEFPFLKISQAPAKMTIHPNTNRAWKDGLNSNADWIITAQDDILCCKNTFKAMDEWVNKAPKNTGMLTLWRPDHSGVHKGYGAWAANQFWGSLFLIFPKKVLEMYFNSKTYEHTKKNIRANDMIIKGFFANEVTHLRIYAYKPSLIQHVGHRSTWCNPNHKRQSASFRGEGFDAAK